jgi:hypothetical protein
MDLNNSSRSLCMGLNTYTFLNAETKILVWGEES